MVPATAITYCTVARLEVLSETQIASFLKSPLRNMPFLNWSGEAGSGHNALPSLPKRDFS